MKRDANKTTSSWDCCQSKMLGNLREDLYNDLKGRKMTTKKVMRKSAFST
jgi:hypothetical protein